MAYHHQDEGWPLGLQRMNNNVQEMPPPPNPVLLERNGSSSLLADSASFSSDSSSDLDTESTGSSFFYDKSITLGNLIGIQSDAGLSARVANGEVGNSGIIIPRRHKRNGRSKSWWGLCGSSFGGKEGEEEGNNMPPSLGHFLEVERRAAASTRREKMYFNLIYDEFTPGSTILDPNPLFADGQILPPSQFADHQYSSSTTDLPQPSNNNTHSSCALADLFKQAPSRNNSVNSMNHQRSPSLGSKVPTFFSGMCGKNSIEA